MAYDPQVISAIDRVLNRLNASPRVRKAAYEAAIVESGVRNLNYGDRDSLGVFQQRPSQGWGSPAQVTDPEYAATQFVERAIRANATGRYRSAGQLAQAVQRSAFPGRYDEQSAEAERILAGLGGGGSTSDTGGSSGSTGPVSASVGPPQIADPGQASDFASLLSSLLSQPKPQPAPVQVQAPSFAAAPPLPQGFRAPTSSASSEPVDHQDRLSQALGLLGSLGGTSPTLRSPDAFPSANGPQARQAPDGEIPSAPKGAGTVAFDGKPVAKWIGEALAYARDQGWGGTVSSGYRSDAEQKRIYDSGVRPAAKPRAYGGGGSNHEFTAYPGGAVDVTDPQGLARALKGSRYEKLLVWAGRKDPVHFSHPHNGSY